MTQKTPRTVRTTVFGAALLLSQLLAGSAFGWPANAAIPASSRQNVLDAFTRIDKKDLEERYRDWLDEVSMIITDDEADVFLRCGSDAQRDQFIEHFWLERDPTPGTPRNEYTDKHYERLAYANLHFGHNTPGPGWRTDQGRIYVILGAPMGRKSLSSTRYAYPAEVWSYHADPKLGIRPFFNIVFFREMGLGEYRLYSPIGDGPRALLNSIGEMRADEIHATLGGAVEEERRAAFQVLLQTDYELAEAALSFVPTQTDMALAMPSMESDMLIAQIEKIPEVVMPVASWAYPILTGSIEAVVRFETLPIAAVATALLDPGGVPFVHYAVRAYGGQLNVREYEGEYYLTFEVAGAITDQQRRVLADIGAGADGARIIQGTLNQEQALQMHSTPVIYVDRVPAVEGDFNFEVILENNVSHEFGRAEIELTVPAAHPRQLASSDPILCLEYLQLDTYDSFAEHYPFQVGLLELMPAVDSPFASGSSLYVFHQVYIPAGLEEMVVTSYRLEGEAGVVKEELAGIDPRQADEHGTVNLVATLDLEGLAAGDYRLYVDLEGDERVAMSVPVRIEAGTEQVHPLFEVQEQSPPTDPRVGYQRALQYRVLGQVEEAIATLSPALARAPDFAEAMDLQTELLMEAGRYEEVDRLLAPRLIKDPNDVELLLTLAKANSGMGRRYDAIRYYERARLAGTEETSELLNDLATEYFADGQVGKARELLERSLQLDPEQPEVRRLLQEMAPGDSR